VKKVYLKRGKFMKKFFLPFFALSILFLSCQISTTSNAEYTVSFDTVGGSDIESQTVLAGDYAEEPSEPAKADAVFVEWVNSKNQAFDFKTTKIYKNTTVYAKWRDLDQISGLTASACNSGTNAGTALALLDNQIYELEYDQVVYLSLKDALEGAVIYYTVDGTEPSTDSSVYTAAGIVPSYGENKKDTFTVKAYASCEGYKDSAVFTCSCTLKKYTVTVDKDDGSENKAYTLYSGEKLNDGTAFDAPSKTDYTFKGWFVGSTEFDFTKVVAYTDAAFTVKALWTENGTLATPTFSISGTEVDYGEEVELGINSSDSLADCTIYYTTDGTTPTTSSLVYSAAIVITDDTTVMAFVHSDDGSLKDSSVITEVFTLKRYTVTFDSVEGSDVDSQTVKSGSKATKPENPTKNNNDFNYWYLENSEVEYDFDTPVISNIELKARWTSTLDETAPGLVGDFNVNGNGVITIIWTNPTDEDFAGVEINIYDSENNLLDTINITDGSESYTYEPGAYGNYIVEIQSYDQNNNMSEAQAAVVKYYLSQGESYINPNDPNPPYFISLFPDSLLIANNGAENIWLPVVVENIGVSKGTERQTSCVDAVNWEVSFDSGTTWTTMSTDINDGFEWQYSNKGILMMRFKASSLNSGTTQFKVIVKSAGDNKSTCVSNTINVIYNTDRSNMVGQKYYQDGVLVGLVCDVDENLNPTKIVALENCGTYQWAPVDTTGYNKQFITVIDDGSMNWEVIKKEDTTAVENASTNYPAFDACNNYSSGDLSWYLPASGELLQLNANRNVMNSVEGFNGFGGNYWTSADVGNNNACYFDFDSGYTNANQKSWSNNNVRAIAKVK
jgi:uncharacterized repeat protein (TIGR02543 family)